MLKDRKKLIAIIIGVVVIVAAVIGFCLWRQHETGANEADGQSDTSQTADNGKKDDDRDGDSGQLTEDEINMLTDIATRYEHAARDWGVDPNSGSSLDLSKQDAQSVLDQIRTPETMDRSALDQLTTMQTTADEGPNAPSEFCQEDAGSALCNGDPTMLAYWRDQHWTMGSRIDSMSVEINDDGTAHVTGTVKYILWSDTDGAATLTPDGSGYWGYSPATGTDDFDETLTIEDGKVTNRDIASYTRWMGDPWFDDWDDNPASDTESWDNRQQPNIPLKGTKPTLPMNNDVSRVMLKNSDDITTNPAWNECIQDLGLTGQPGVSDDQFMTEEEWEELFGSGAD